MDEIKENEYIRTKTGIIDKIIHYDNDTKLLRCKNNNFIDPFDNIAIPISTIVKHSFNIIDLIEVGDFVNENEVIDKYLFDGEIPVLETTGDETNAKCMCEGDIKTILTHEQYERNCYKIN